jgi:hypothetical protein
MRSSGEFVAEVRRGLVAAISLLVALLAVVCAPPSALGDESLAWRKTAWRFHPPDGYPSTETYEHEEIELLANGRVAMVGRLGSSGDGLVQLHDEAGRWLWTVVLPGKDAGVWSYMGAAAVRSGSGRWDMVVSDDGSHTVWRLDDRGKLLWRRSLRGEVGLAWTGIIAVEDGGIWLGGWAETEDYECGDGAGVVKLDEQGDVVWRWRDPGGISSAAIDLVPVGDGRVLALVVENVGCTAALESELVLLDADGEEILRAELPIDHASRPMIRLADGRVALLDPRGGSWEANRLFILSFDAPANALSVTEAGLDPSLATGDDFYFLPATASQDGSLLFFVGYALQWLSPDGRIVRTERVPPEDWRRCQIQPSKVLCVDPYLLRWIAVP